MAQINQHILQGERAEYGKDIISQLSKKITAEFVRGWSKRNLAQMVKFAVSFSDLYILQALSAKLSWSHFNQLAYIDDPIKREFYATMAAQERCSVRTLFERIDKMLFEHTAISRRSDENPPLGIILCASKKTSK